MCHSANTVGIFTPQNLYQLSAVFALTDFDVFGLAFWQFSGY